LELVRRAVRSADGASVGLGVAMSGLLGLASAGVRPMLAQTTNPATTAPGVIHACYVPLTGTLYRIKETNLRQACSSSTNVEFAWTDGVGALHGTDEIKGDLNGTFGAPTVVGLRGIGVAKDAPKKGQVLTFDGNLWSPGDVPTVNTGVVDGSFLASGTYGAGVIPATGAGVRMMWYPGKAAFRVGVVGGTEWDDANIGPYSFATGSATFASGMASAALGLNTLATGQAAVATGFSSRASGNASMAVGVFAQATGDQSVAMGNAASATGAYAIAMGVALSATGNESVALGGRASTNGHTGSFVFGDHSTAAMSNGTINSNSDNQFVIRAQHMWFGTDNSVTATPDRFLETSTGAYLSSGGTWTNVSDVHRKHLFEDVSADEILDRVAALPIKKWSYKAEADSVRHLGPTAQDFYGAFHLGPSDTSIPTIDADGVSLAAIQALAKRTTALTAENAELRARLDALEAVIQQLQRAPRDR
jgi:hypothetical protein